MKDRLDRFIKQRFQAFTEELTQSWGVRQAILCKHESVLKGVFARYLSMACSATFSARGTSKKEFMDALVECGFLAQALALKGLENPASVLMRQCIELVLKHIYYIFHPVEYHWSKTRVAYRDITFRVLLEFIKRTEEHHEFMTHLDICETLEEQYGVLSRHVHVHSRVFLGYAGMPGRHPTRDIAQKLRKFDSTTQAVWPALVALLILMFPGNFLAAQAREQDLASLCLPREVRGLLHKYCCDQNRPRYL